MYEEKSKRSIQINWKSLLIKLAILLVVVFLIIWIISLFKKNNNESNFGTNLGLMRDAATEYFTGSKLPSEVNDKESITLKEMYSKKLLVEFKDENGNSCDTTNSYAEVTKIDEENYRLEVKLVCKNESDTIINTIKRQTTNNNDNNLDDDSDDSLNNEDNDQVIDDNAEDNNLSDNSGSSNNNSNNKPGNNGSIAVKPDDKPSDSTSTGNNNNNNSNNNNNNNSSNNNNNNISNVCGYGKKEYSTKYPLAYVVSGDCAVSASAISGEHATKATIVGNKEYLKLVKEMKELENTTGTKLEISNPIYEKVPNLANNGYVGYQIIFEVKEKISTYGAKTVYAYYLDQSGNRITIIDNRSSLYF